MGLQVDKPLFLLFFIPVIIILFLYWKQNRTTPRFEKTTILSLRLIIFLCLIFALSVPQILYPVKGMTTVFVVDTSASMKNQQTAMYSQIEQAISDMSPDDRYAIISVAEHAQIVQSLSSREKGININTVTEKNDYTNIAEGIQLASSLISDNMKGRIVLMSDGNENVGDVKQQVKLLHDQQIPVDVLPFYPSIHKDVAIEQFIAPSTVYLGENAKLSITISSTLDTTSQIRITSNNETVIDEMIQVKKGKNSYTFDRFVEKPGIHTFKAEIVAKGDGVPQNNQSFAISRAKGTPSILLVEGKDGESHNLYKALHSSGLHVTKTNPALLPTTLAGYLEYESIIFSNVSATDITGIQMDMIESAVKDFGTGFVMTGGNQSYGLGGYFKTPIEKILPVEMDLKGKKELPSLGMIIVLDRSGSMSGYKLDLAKEAAARSVELLREKDTLGFIAFDDRPWQIIETGPLKNKDEAADKIRSITGGGGTEIFTSLEEAYNQLAPLKLQRKHIILLTDGQSATNGNYSDLISSGLENNVTLSTVAIGSDADRVLLEQLATEGTGRFYDVVDASTIPSILSRETVLTTRTYIEDDPFYPKYVEGTNWSSLFQNGIPQMNAYVATDPKGRAETILFSEKDDPVLTRWKYGLGSTIAWTSDVSGEWAGNWPAWSNWSALWNDMITWTFPTYQSDLYDINQSINGKNVTLDVTSTDQDMLPIEAKVVDEKGKTIDAKIRAKAPGKHEVTFTADTGIYYLQLSKMDGEHVTSTFQSGIVVPYSKEFALQDQNNTLLKEVADLGNGKVITEAGEAFRAIDNEKYEKQNVLVPLLLLAFLLFFIEIAVRRFGLTPVIEKLRAARIEKSDQQVEKKKRIEQTYSRLKKVSASSAKPAKNMNMDEQKIQPNRMVERKEPSKALDKNQDDRNDRMKRLLDAKKGKRRG